MAKQYPIHQSPLYKLSGLKQLESCLSIDLNRLDKLLKEGAYRTWDNDNDREIQHPQGWLGQVHKKIAKYLSKLETPDYVYHKKNRSHIKNAAEHLGFHPVVKTDISSYYPSVTKQMLKKMFIKHFKCAIDIAVILSDICTYRRTHLATGSPVSGYLAFWANKDMFDRVYELSKFKGCTFTLYVDDLTISGGAATKSLLKEIRGLVAKTGMKTKDSKSITFPPYAAKTITGVIIKGNECFLPNARHKDIAADRVSIETLGNSEAQEVIKKSLNGKLMAAKQITNLKPAEIVTSMDLIYS